MAGRSRQAKGQIGALATALNIDRSELRNVSAQALSSSIYPPRDLKQLLPLVEPNDVLEVKHVEHMVKIKESFVNSCREGPFFFEGVLRERDIERYTDRLKKRSAAKDWMPDLRRIPKELWPPSVLKRPAQPSSEKSKRPRQKEGFLAQRLDALEAIEASSAEKSDAIKEEEESEEDEEGKERERVADEEEVEDEEEGEFTDYAHTYFDNGDDYLEDSEDNPDDAATF